MWISEPTPVMSRTNVSDSGSMQQAGVDVEAADRHPAEQVLVDLALVAARPFTEKNSTTA